MENTKFTAIDVNGETKEFQALLTYNDPDTLKNYIVYTDYSKDNNGKLNLMSSIYEGDKNNFNLIPIESDKELELVDELIKTVLEEIQTGK